MLTHITIKDFAIVEHLEIDFMRGLSVLTGETGAGKSLWVDAIQLALGQRADTQWIRADRNRAEINVIFDISQLPNAQAWLAEMDIEHDNTCILRRIIARQGQSRCTLNGTPIPLQKMRDFAHTLIQVHSQHQQQLILQSDYQRQLLDELSGDIKTLQSIQSQYQQWKYITAEINTLQQQQDTSQEAAFIQYQLNEFETLNLQADEWTRLSQQHTQYHKANQYLDTLNQAIDLTSESDRASAMQLLQRALDHLNTIQQPDKHLTEINELLNNALIHITEASSALQHYRDSFQDLDLPIEKIEARISLIHDLARKHHSKPEALAEAQQLLQEKFDALGSREQRLQTLLKQQENLLADYIKTAKKLTKLRQAAAKQLSAHITSAMRQMDIQDAIFSVQFEKLPDTPTAYGLDKIQFMVQTNAGQGQQPLHKIASGGEISRVSLAMHVLTASQAQTPTLVFDEVDVGISGKTAAIVGQLLQTLGTKTQVFCITHLPQVACFGHQHYKAEKVSDGQQTITRITHLDKDGRIQELARLLGGTSITPQSLAHAEDLLEAHA
jgi:DNA repair protein RecN (Recombination protein N)